MHKAPSSPALSNLLDTSSASGSVNSPGAEKESLADLWQNFLEQEASASAGAGGGKSRTPSVVSTPTGGAGGFMSPSSTSGLPANFNKPL